jgi:chromosome segregation ATPase
MGDVMSELIERRVAKLAEDASAVQSTVSKLLLEVTEVQRGVRRLVQQGTSHNARLGGMEVAVNGLREGQRTLEDQLDQVGDRLDRIETVTAEILRRLPERETE